MKERERYKITSLMCDIKIKSQRQHNLRTGLKNWTYYGRVGRKFNKETPETIVMGSESGKCAVGTLYAQNCIDNIL